MRKRIGDFIVSLEDGDLIATHDTGAWSTIVTLDYIENKFGTFLDFDDNIVVDEEGFLEVWNDLTDEDFRDLEDALQEDMDDWHEGD